MKPHETCALEQLPADEHDQHDRQLDVEADEADGAERGAEAAPALDEDQERIEHDGEERTPGIRPVLEGQQMLLSLSSDRGPETEGCKADGDPGELVRDTDDAVRLSIRWNVLGENEGPTSAAMSTIARRQ